MPFFMWKGITLDGSMKRGFMQMPNISRLDKRLFEMDIALLHHYETWHPAQVIPVGTHHIKEFFQQLTTFVNAGVLLTDSLDMVAGQLSHPALQDSVYAMATDVRSGIPFHTVLRQYSALYSPLMIHLVLIAEETGTVGKALDTINGILADDIERRRHIKSMLFVPIFTTCSMVMLIIFLVKIIVPHFVSIFASMKLSIPPLTQALVTVGNFFSLECLLVLLCGAIGTYCMLRIKRIRESVAAWVTIAVLKVPYVGSLWAQHYASRCYMSMGVLLGSGIKLLPALHIVTSGIDNTVLHEIWMRIVDDVSHGIPLSRALRKHNARGFFRTDTIALITTGEETGLLATMVNQAAFIEYERYKNQTKRFFTILQPTLLIILGIMVLLIVIAIYEPIMALSVAL